MVVSWNRLDFPGTGKPLIELLLIVYRRTPIAVSAATLPLPWYRSGIQRQLTIPMRRPL
jgi:hypothetical protein